MCKNHDVHYRYQCPYHAEYNRISDRVSACFSSPVVDLNAHCGITLALNVFAKNSGPSLSGTRPN